MEEDYSEYELAVNCSSCGDEMVVFTDLYDRPESEIREVATCNDCKQAEAADAAYSHELGTVPMGQQARAEQTQ